jgi:hypothetical protein
MFTRTRERLDRIERMLEALATKVDAPHARPATDAVADLLGKMMASNVDLVGAMGDLAVRSVARRNGIRGGTRAAATATRDKNGKFLPKRIRERSAPVCALCRYGEGYPGVTIDMIKTHRAHTQSGYQGYEGHNDDSTPTDPTESRDDQLARDASADRDAERGN